MSKLFSEESQETLTSHWPERHMIPIFKPFLGKENRTTIWLRSTIIHPPEAQNKALKPMGMKHRGFPIRTDEEEQRVVCVMG